MLLRALLVLFITFLSLESEAGTVNLLGRPIQAVIPTGYCEVGGHPAEAEMVRLTREEMGNSNQILVIFAECKELEDLRKGRRNSFDNYGLILAQTPKGQLRPQKGTSRSEWIQKIMARSSYIPEAVKKAEQHIKQYDPEFQKIESLGILGTDSNGVYVGLLMTVTDDTGRPRPIVGVLGWTLVKEFPISINLYQAYQNTPDLRDLLARDQKATANLVRAND